MNKHKKLKWRPKAEVYASVCNVFKKCKICNRVYYVPLTENAMLHVCTLEKFKTCGGVLDSEEEETHKCYIQALSPKDDYNHKLIFYDFETFANESGVHTPFFVSTKTLWGVSWSLWGLHCTREFVLHFRRPKC